MAFSKSPMAKSRSRNIDQFLDSLIEAQEQNGGVRTHLRKALFDPYTNRRINCFERKRLEEQGVDLSSYSDADGEVVKKKDVSTLPLLRGVYAISEEDLCPEEDDFYICEYCRQIGRDNKYRPEVCDMCTCCEQCSEAMADECDGCSYSTYYNGTTYGEANQEEVEPVEFDETLDAKVIHQLNEDCKKPRRPDGGFTIMKY